MMVTRPPTGRFFIRPTLRLLRNRFPETRHKPERGPFSPLHLSLREWPRLPFTARIERAQLHHARSASKKGTWSLPPLLQACSLPLQGWSLNDLPLRVFNEALLTLHLLQRGEANRPSLRASSDHRFIVGALRAKRTVACPLAYLQFCPPTRTLIPSRSSLA